MENRVERYHFFFVNFLVFSGTHVSRVTRVLPVAFISGAKVKVWSRIIRALTEAVISLNISYYSYKLPFRLG